MNKFFFLLFLPFMFGRPVQAQDSALPDNFLFDDSDIIVTAPEETPAVKNIDTEEAAADAVSAARDLLNRQPAKLRHKTFPKLKNRTPGRRLSASSDAEEDAPFGLLWGSGIADTRTQGVQLSVAEMEDYVNSFLAQRLPKPIAFFDRVYVVYGKEDELYRILAYSKKIDDDAAASKILHEYETYSELLNKKYGNKEQDFTPAMISKTIKNAKGQDETVREAAPIGNPDFLAQLQSGSAVLFSTYYNDRVAAALSIGVDGDKKSYIVIDYKNLRILEKQEAETLDAL